MLIRELVDAMEEIAPTRHAEAWDNVGLLAGDPGQAVTMVMLCIDYTPGVAEEARAAGCDAVVAYHPPIFDPLKRLTAGSVVFDAIRRGVALYSPHTALDVAEGGTNDMLADAMGLVERSPLKLAETKAGQLKLVTFVPEEKVEAVSEALFAAGAGRIGEYASCSFRLNGTGTFLGGEGTNPAVGEKGKLERVPEVRVETVVPAGRVAAALKALYASHPYEEPAFDLVQLAAPPEKTGIGRIGPFAERVDRREVVERVKRELRLERVLVAGPGEGPAARGACCAGACGKLLDDALGQRADVYLTGELRHHDALKAAAAGMTVICTLHSNSERAVLRRLAGRLEDRLPGLGVVVSRVDRDPFLLR